MGLFDKKKMQIKVTEPGKIYAPVTGKYIPISDYRMKFFRQEYLDKDVG